jgi:Asp-tRNA(Asn)/Glu-tRNA(Gln) amidotransferase A subunit family amidase
MRAARRRFIAGLAKLGAAAGLLPQLSHAQTTTAAPAATGVGVTVENLKAAAALADLKFSDEEYATTLTGVRENLGRYQLMRQQAIPNDLAPPFYFNPLVPGMKVRRTQEPLRFSGNPVTRPDKLEDVAFWPVMHLAHLLQTRQVTSVELTQMYLARLHNYNGKLNCVVSFCDELALSQARKADAEITAGNYKGLLHGMPWGAKDIIAVNGFKTTWGSGAYKDQSFASDATIVKLLNDAGAVTLAKLTTGELAGGDQWFGGRTNSPWNLEEGSSGSSAGSASATAAGLVPFAIGTETGGSILSPAARCGATGLRPTFGRVSRHGVMALAWTQDRLGPICRYAEDCAAVMSVIAHPDDLDLSVSELPFNWDAKLSPASLKVGYFADAFADKERLPEWIANDRKTLDQLTKLGVQLIPLQVPDFPNEVLSVSVEAAVFFDELVRTDQHKLLTAKTKADRFRVSRFVPAVEYLQSQRLRSAMMQALAQATAGVDVYLAPSTQSNPRNPDGSNNNTIRNKTWQHNQMANLACYPGLAVPNGFTAQGTPTSISFMARPFGEAELLVLGKAYQDAAGFHRQHPPLFS